MAEQGFVQDLIGGPLDEQHRRMYELASPITHVNGHSPPHLLAHGDADELVPYEQSPLFLEAMQRAGVSCRLLRLPGVGHSGRHLYSNAEVRRHVAEFFVRHLRP